MRPFNRRSIAAVAAAAMAVATFAQVIFSALASELIEEFDVDRWQVGFLVTAAAITGALLSPTFGRLTDRWGGSRSVTGVFGFGLLSLGIIAAAPVYPVLALGAVLSGMAQGWGNPSTNALIVESVTPGTRGAITGIKQSGVQMGTFLGGLLLPPVAVVWGWRWAVALFLLAPLVGLVTMRGRGTGTPHVFSGRRSRGAVPEVVRWVALYGAITGLATSAIFTFLPLFAEEDQGWSDPQAGWLLAGIGLVGVVGRIWWGTNAERRFGHGRSLLLMAAMSAVSSGILVLAAAGVVPGWALLPAALLFAAGANAWNSVGMLAVMDFSPADLVGRGTGLVLLGFLLGVGIGAPLMGLSVDQFDSYGPGWAAVTVLFLTGVVLAVRITRTSAQPPLTA